jgi:hypothetical protein
MELIRAKTPTNSTFELQNSKQTQIFTAEERKVRRAYSFRAKHVLSGSRRNAKGAKSGEP